MYNGWYLSWIVSIYWPLIVSNKAINGQGLPMSASDKTDSEGQIRNTSEVGLTYTVTSIQKGGIYSLT